MVGPRRSTRRPPAGFERFRERPEGIVEEDTRGGARGGIPFLPRGVHPRGDDRSAPRDRRLERRVVRKTQVPPEPDDGRRGYTFHWHRASPQGGGIHSGSRCQYTGTPPGVVGKRHRIRRWDRRGNRIEGPGPELREFVDQVPALPDGIDGRAARRRRGPDRRARSIRGPGSRGRVRAGDVRPLGFGNDRGTGQPVRHRAPGRPRRRAFPGTGAGGSPEPSTRSGR